MDEITIYTLTVDDNREITTLALGTEQECLDALRDNFGDDIENVDEMNDDEILTELTEHQGVVVYIDSHLVKLPN